LISSNPITRTGILSFIIRFWLFIFMFEAQRCFSRNSYPAAKALAGGVCPVAWLIKEQSAGFRSNNGKSAPYQMKAKRYFGP
jgi:hypothetical protein